MSYGSDRLIEIKLQAIEKLYDKLHVQTNKEYVKYDKVKETIESEIGQLQREIEQIERAVNDK